MRFIFASEESGFRHLYLYTVQLAVSPNETSIADGIDHFSSLIERKTDLHSMFSLVTGVCRATHIDKQQLTSGDWEVLDQWLWVDHTFGLVYFMGLRDSPLSSHLYVTSYVRPGSNIIRLTQSGYSHTVSMNKVNIKGKCLRLLKLFNSLCLTDLKECTVFVTVYSNTQSMPACQVVALEPSADLVHPVPLAFLVEPAR